MANPYDAGARLAEGRPAVDDVAEYVRACHRLGYQHRDLTAHPSQVGDWYDSELGLDLRALDADCAALAGAAAAAEDAARTHRDLVAELSGAWSGSGAAAAREFAWRSGRAATSVSTAVRGAADALASLRDGLWRAVDAKVATVQAIDGRHGAQRAEWLAAARTVTTGGGDLASASELIDQQVKPFVVNDIGSDWVAAMRAAIASIGAAYDAAIASISGGPPAVFDVPGALGPRADAVGDGRDPGEAVAPTPTSVSAVTPARVDMSPTTAPLTRETAPVPAWPTPAPPAAASAVDPMASAPLTSPTAPAAMPASPAAPPMGELGGTAPALGAGVSGFGQQLADLIGGLVGSTGGAEEVGMDGSFDGTNEDPATDTAEEEDEDDSEGDGADEPPPDDESAPEPTEEPAEEAVEEPPPGPDPEPTPVPPPAPEALPAVPPAVPESVGETSGLTPCEIAADELPQVGE